MINTISVEAIEEFKTSSGAFSAEYGRGTGGAINVTTKSGTNKFHGTLLEFFRNDKLDANTFFSNRSGLAKPQLRHNQFGGNFGGPILKNKLFFFFNYEGDRIVRGRDITGNITSPLLLSQITNPALVKFSTDFNPTSQTPTSNPLVSFHRRNDAQRVSEDTTLSRIDLNLDKHRMSPSGVPKRWANPEYRERMRRMGREKALRQWANYRAGIGKRPGPALNGS